MQAVIVGVGSLGNVAAKLLAEKGNNILLIDDDKVEKKNLERQPLYTIQDVGKLKVMAAKTHLKKLYPKAKIDACPERICTGNVKKLKAEVVLDCTDNLASRFLINDFCSKEKIPWVHAAAVGSKGVVFSVIPGQPCLRCVYPRSIDTETCNDEGILNKTSAITASLQTEQAILILNGKQAEKRLVRLDAEQNSVEKISVRKNKKCPACNGNFRFLKDDSDFFIKKCKTKAAYSARPKNSIRLDLNKIKNEFKTEVDTPILLVLDVEGGIVVHSYGQITFKKLNDEKKIRKISEKIYKLGK